MLANRVSFLRQNSHLIRAHLMGAATTYTQFSVALLAIVRPGPSSLAWLQQGVGLPIEFWSRCGSAMAFKFTRFEPNWQPIWQSILNTYK